MYYVSWPRMPAQSDVWEKFHPKNLVCGSLDHTIGEWNSFQISFFCWDFRDCLIPPVQGSDVKIDGQAESDLLCHVSVTLLAGILFISAGWPPDGLILPGFAYQSRLASIIHQYTDSVLQTITVHLGCCLKLFNPQPSTFENYFWHSEIPISVLSVTCSWCLKSFTIWWSMIGSQVVFLVRQSASRWVLPLFNFIKNGNNHKCHQRSRSTF